MKQDVETTVTQSNTHLHNTIHWLVPDSNHTHWIACSNKHNCSNSKLQYSHCPILTLNLMLHSAPSLTELWTSGGTCSELQDRLKTVCKLWKTLSDISLPLLWQDTQTLVRVKDRSSHFLREWGPQHLHPKELANEEYANSCSATEPLVRAVMKQRRGGMDKYTEEVRRIRSDFNNEKRKHAHVKSETIRDWAQDTMKLAMNLAKEKGASSWLSVLSIDEFGFFLH